MEKDNLKNKEQCAIHDVSGSTDKLVRALKNEIYKYSIKYNNYFGGNIEYLKRDYERLIKHGNSFQIKTVLKYSKKYGGQIEIEYKKYDIPNYNERLNGIKIVLDIYNTANELKLGEQWVDDIHHEYFLDRYQREQEINKKPLGERRDNRKEKVINGYDNRYQHTNARYPSKKRSKKQWKNFYNLFPNLAKRDNWNGVKSDRM
jgi:hypothetical protein